MNAQLNYHLSEMEKCRRAMISRHPSFPEFVADKFGVHHTQDPTEIVDAILSGVAKSL